jgi:hypothetical protein
LLLFWKTKRFQERVFVFCRAESEIWFETKASVGTCFKVYYIFQVLLKPSAKQNKRFCFFSGKEEGLKSGSLSPVGQKARFDLG